MDAAEEYGYDQRQPHQGSDAELRARHGLLAKRGWRGKQHRKNTKRCDGIDLRYTRRFANRANDREERRDPENPLQAEANAVEHRVILMAADL